MQLTVKLPQIMRCIVMKTLNGRLPPGRASALNHADRIVDWPIELIEGVDYQTCAANGRADDMRHASVLG